MTKQKTLGQVFTPSWIVEEILNSVGFTGPNILDKKIIDPASGDGAFLKIIVYKIIDYLLSLGYSTEKIKSYLEENVYGIEIDEQEFSNCIRNLDIIVAERLGKDIHVSWKIFKDNTLMRYKTYLEFFDFVVGNPPYIRIHNLDEETRNLLKNEFIFSDGTIDIYLSFFELGFKILNKQGMLGYITPNSYLHNSSYVRFRKYLKETRAVKTLTDFKANKIFSNVSTYTAITIINFFEKKDNFTYKELIDNKIKEINNINYLDLVDKDWSFSGNEEMDFLKNLDSGKTLKVSNFFDVQYGFATLRDKIYIGDVFESKDNLCLFNGHWVEKEILFNIVKGSTYKGKETETKKVIFPYKKGNDKFVPIPEEELKSKYPHAYQYLLSNKEELLKRDIDRGASWYEFGRSQGVQTIHNEKIVISTLIKDKVNFYKLNKETFVYSGLFIIKKREDVDWNIIIDILNSDNFFKYIRMTGKDFSGGYKSITSNQIKNYSTRELADKKTSSD